MFRLGPHLPKETLERLWLTKALGEGAKPLSVDCDGRLGRKRQRAVLDLGADATWGSRR